MPFDECARDDAGQPGATTVGVALILTGHLRDTCASPDGVEAVSKVVRACRSQFCRCDLFIFTWDRLDKAERYHHRGGEQCDINCRRNLHSWAANRSYPCVALLDASLNATATLVEHQPTLPPAAWRKWGMANETLANFYMNAEAMAR